MPKHRAVFDFIAELDDCSTANTLIEKFQRLVERFGIASFAVGDATSPQLHRVDRFWASTYPEEWAKLWIDKDYISVDPVIHQLFMQATPFRWSDLRKRQTGTGARVMDAARDFGLYDGLSVGAHALRGGMVGLTMAGERLELDRHDETMLHLASIYFQAKLQKLLNLGASADGSLTRRERDCLSWAAMGKTDQDISVILGIGTETVRQYMKQALRKPNATNRTHAVALALKKRLIRP